MQDMNKSLNIDFEKAVRLLVEYMPLSDEHSRKPALFHDIRVGVYLYERNYSRDVVIAGVLHDAIKWSRITENMLRKVFGDNVTKLVLACTKDDSLEDAKVKIDELIQRCVKNGQDALIVKAADIIDSFNYYTKTKNEIELQYCKRNAHAIFRHKPNNYSDGIFDELKNWHEKSV